MAHLVSVEGRDPLRQLLVGRGAVSQAAVVAVAERVQLAIHGDHGTVLEATRHLMRIIITHTHTC